jgi:hypothetical protein
MLKAIKEERKGLRSAEPQKWEHQVPIKGSI